MNNENRIAIVAVPEEEVPRGHVVPIISGEFADGCHIATFSDGKETK